MSNIGQLEKPVIVRDLEEGTENVVTFKENLTVADILAAAGKPDTAIATSNGRRLAGDTLATPGLEMETASAIANG